MELLAPPLDRASLRGVDVISLALVARRLRVPLPVVDALIACGDLGAVRVDESLVIPLSALHAFENDPVARRPTQVLAS
jgi:hypothetical protein